MQTPQHTPDVTTPEIPDKLYFRIGEVAQLAGVEPYVLRFWETEFPQLAPKKSGTGHRLFRRKEVELVLEVKRLLYEKRFTIEGARLYLEQNKAAAKSGKKKAGTKTIAAPDATPQTQGDLFGRVPQASLDAIRTELTAIYNLLL